jgi:hypothetical protein
VLVQGFQNGEETFDFVVHTRAIYFCQAFKSRRNSCVALQKNLFDFHCGARILRSTFRGVPRKTGLRSHPNNLIRIMPA